MSDLQRCGFKERTHQRATAEFGLESCLAMHDSARKGLVGRVARAALIEHAANELGFGFVRPPWFGDPAADSDPNGTNLPVGRKIEGDRGRCEREIVRLAISDLEVERAAGPGARRNLN